MIDARGLQYDSLVRGRVSYDLEVQDSTGYLKFKGPAPKLIQIALDTGTEALFFGAAPTYIPIWFDSTLLQEIYGDQIFTNVDAQRNMIWTDTAITGTCLDTVKDFVGGESFIESRYLQSAEGEDLVDSYGVYADLPYVSGLGTEQIFDLSPLSDERWNKNAYVGNAFSLPEYYDFPYVNIYYDAANPYHWKIKDFHYRYYEEQADALTNIAFAKLSYSGGVLQSSDELLLYSTEQTGTELADIKSYIGLISGTNYYTNESLDLRFEFNITGSAVTINLTADEDITVYWGDGASNTYNGTEVNASHTYASSDDYTITMTSVTESALTRFSTSSNVNFDFDITDLPSGLTYFSCSGSNTVSGDIANLPSGLTLFRCYGSNTVSGDIANLPSGLTYFACFASNTVSGDIANLPSGLTYFSCSGSNTVSGDIANLPSGLTLFNCSGSNTVSGDIVNLPSGLTYLGCYGSNTVSGDIANLPSGLTYFACSGSNTISSYTGKTWTTKPDTFVLIGLNTLSSTSVDNLLIDLDDDLTWSGGTITITGNSGSRTAASDSAVSNLQSEGVTVTTN